MMLFQLHQRNLMMFLFLLGLLLPTGWLLALPAASSLAAPNQPSGSLLEPTTRRGFDCKGGSLADSNIVPLSAPDSGTATIRGRVWRDVDGDGLEGPNEPGVAEVECVLCRLGFGAVVITTTTDGGGFYSLTVSPTLQGTGGEYYLLFGSTDDQLGFTPSDVGEGLNVSNSDVEPEADAPAGYPLFGRTENFKLQDGDNAIFNAGLVDLPSVHGFKWHDLNGDGVKDPDEPALEGWQIKISNGQQSGQTVTSLAGSYGFTGLSADEYMLSEMQQAGWLQTFPPGSGIHTVALAERDVLQDINFGNQELACVPPPENMVAWWALDEQQGQISHDMAGGHDGTQVNAPLPVAGKVDGALLFDGADDYVEVLDAPALSFYAEGASQGMSDFTIDAWIRMSNTTSTIVDKLYRDDTEAAWGYSFVVNGGFLELWLGEGTLGVTTISSDAFVVDGEWHHVAVVVEQASQSVIFYDNGMAVGAESLPDLSFVTQNNLSPLRIGASASESFPYFQGEIDQVELFNRALLPTEIAAIHQADSFGKCKGSIQGTKWHDMNGNGQQDANEPGLEGWTILLTTGFGEVISTTTNTAGDYAFMGLAPSNYTVAEQFQSGWAQTFPLQGSHLVPLGLNQVAQEINFGNVQQSDDYCHIGWDVHLNPNWDAVEVYMSIFNDEAATYQVDLMALPGMDGLTTFTTTPTTPLVVDGYEQLQVRIEPLPYISDSVGPYQAIVTNIETGISFGCTAQIWDSNNTFWLDSEEEGMQAIPFGEAQELTFAFHNFSPQALQVAFNIEGMFMAPDPQKPPNSPLISLDGMEPGSTISGNMTVQAGETISIPVTVEFMSHPTAGAGDILFSVDINNDQQSDGITSIAVRSVKEIITPTPTPTATMTPTATATSTMTPTPTATPTMMQEIYLPLMMRE